MENKTIDISTVTDVAQLREMYVTFNEDLIAAQRNAEIANHNLQLTRSRMAELQDGAQAAPAVTPPAEDKTAPSKKDKTAPTPTK